MEILNGYDLFLLGEKDAQELAELESACFSLPWSREQYEKFLAVSKDSGKIKSESVNSENLPFPAPAPVFGLKEKNGKLAAYLSLGLYPAASELEIYNVAVRPELRNAGLGKFLLKLALNRAVVSGYTRAVLEVRPSNAPALSVYGGLGFVLCGRRKKYYTDTGEDALVLECDLVNSLKI